MFVDEAEIYIRSGNGGSGSVSFRREKFVPKGGPDGGDGGDGGHVIFEVDPQLNTLRVFAGKHNWNAGHGDGGSGSNKTGKSGKPLTIRVPPGTLIFDRDTNLQLKDLTRPGESVVLLEGGKGGRGNIRFTSSTEQAPRYAAPGEQGGQRHLRLELKLIADVGLVGLPNAGKSTLLARTTKARPKIADYPFTTLEPQLGIVELPQYRTYVMADIPGLIEGASAGAGLGDAFLKHIERTRIIIHVIDICPLEGQPPATEAYDIIRRELQEHSAVLAKKPEIVVANKMDMTTSQDHLQALEEALACRIVPISAVTGAGIEQLHNLIWKTLEARKELEQSGELTLPPK